MTRLLRKISDLVVTICLCSFCGSFLHLINSSLIICFAVSNVVSRIAIDFRFSILYVGLKLQRNAGG